MRVTNVPPGLGVLGLVAMAANLTLAPAALAETTLKVALHFDL